MRPGARSRASRAVRASGRCGIPSQPRGPCGRVHHRPPPSSRRRSSSPRRHSGARALLHPAPFGLERTGGDDDRVTRRRTGARHSVTEVVPDAQRTRCDVRGDEGRRPHERVDSVRARKDREHELEILDVAGHRPDRAHVDHAGVAGGRPAARLRHETRCRSEADGPAVVRRHPDGAAAVRSDPHDRGVGASSAASPPLEPPGVLAGSSGCSVLPVTTLSVSYDQVYSGTFVFATITAPASRRRWTAVASLRGTCPTRASEPLKRRETFRLKRVLHRDGQPEQLHRRRRRLDARPRARPVRAPRPDRT